MARKTRVAWIGNQKARKAAFTKRMDGLMKKTYELTVLCDMSACLIILDREENRLVMWPSPEEVKSLLDSFYSLPEYERNMKAVDPESFVKTNIQKTEKKLADFRKVIAELEMEHLMFELQMGRQLVDLSQAEVDKLISYSEKKITCSREKLGSTEQFHASVNEAPLGDETPRASSNAASGWVGNGFNATETGSVYIIDQWFFDDQEVQNHCDETHLPTTVTGLDLNLEPSDIDEDKATYRGESSKAGGTEDDAE